MSFKGLFVCVWLVFIFGCNNNHKIDVTPQIQNHAHQLVYDMVQKVGNYDAFLQKKDVIYTYTYQTRDGKKDVSTEKYIFDGELSYGSYMEHERTFPNLEGRIEQCYDGKDYWLKHNGKYLDDENMMKRVAFNRPTNFYWFAMMQKLLDPGIIYESIGETTIDKKNYDIVKVSFNTEDEKPSDIYQLYINKKSGLVDQFLFTVADFGKMEPSLMQLEYIEVDGIKIPSKRRYKASTWDAEITSGPWVHVNWTDIKFNNGLSKADFRRM